LVSINLLRPKLLGASLFLLFVNALAFAVFFKYAKPSLNIFPDNQAPYNWSINAWHDSDASISLEDSVVLINAVLKLSGKPERAPNAGISIDFNEDEDRTVSFAEFSRIKILLKCSTRTTLYLALAIQDPKVTKYKDHLTYRSAGTYIACDTEWREVVTKLDSLEVPLWWLSVFKFGASENAYDLSKVARIYLDANYEAPRDTDIKINVAKISFDGKKEGYLVVFAAVSLLFWVCFLGWVVRFYWNENRGKGVVQVLEYEQLHFDAVKDRDKQAVLEYISKNFADREIDIDSVCKTVGVSRSKVNDILKAEFGITFTNYINNLRLIEASRLLIEKPDARITEIAYSLGFKNVSYFNVLFKAQFGSTPKTFKIKKDPS
jgi:AraC-like DNA-binding protein